MMPRTDRRWIVVIAGALLAIALVRVLVADSRLGLSLPSILPIVLAAYCFGARGALYAAAAATVLFVAGSTDLDGSDLLIATATRAGVFFGSGLLVAELLRREAEQASELVELRVLREALVPTSVPVTPGLDVATAYVAAEAQVAGDFFLVVPGPDRRTLLAVGDAVGHGVAAARRAAYTRAILAMLAANSQDPAKLLELANAALVDGGMDFVTVVCALVDDDRVTWSSAGHPPPWDLDTGQPLATVEPHEPLGISRDLRCSATTVDLAPRGGLLLFSDGLTEARPPGGSLGGRRLLGEAAVRAELVARPGAAPTEVVRTLSAAARSFAGGGLADDLCLLAARRT
jgi:serine phosphatase RsbU (regulator of sigma subunit)